nr:class A beta-lactamase [Ramlibacter paludis]
MPSHAEDSAWEALEREAKGRLGVAVLRAGGGLEGHRLEERFPMCSTFKWLAAAYVLHRVEMNQERLERRIRFTRDQLKAYSPVTSRHVGGDGMTVRDLCHAAITESDNTAANLLLASFGGPQALTRYARSAGDDATRLDRWEPALNEAKPGDPRDTTTPRAMAGVLHAHLIGNALAPPGREQLAKWLRASETNHLRLRADLPDGWTMGSKTGTGAHGTTNDVGIFWPPNRPPIIVAAFLTQTKAPEAVRNRTIAQVAKRVTSAR